MQSTLFFILELGFNAKLNKSTRMSQARLQVLVGQNKNKKTMFATKFIITHAKKKNLNAKKTNENLEHWQSIQRKNEEIGKEKLNKPPKNSVRNTKQLKRRQRKKK